MKCGRCAFEADDLSEHALEAQHFLCICCRRRSLTEHERQTCSRCIARVRADLADIAFESSMVPSDTLTGLTLLGDGTMQRLPRAEELQGDIHDEWPSDPLPVLPALASWEDMIREEYGDPKGPPDPTLSQVIDYLTSNLDSRHTIAQTFHAFDELAAEIRKHRSAIQHAAGLADDPMEAPGKCFDCGSGQLLRTYGPQGLTDEWTCGECRSVYDQTSYFLALKAHMIEAPPTWRRLSVAAWIVDRPFRTVQTWARGLVVAFACDVETGHRLVWMPDVKAADIADKERAAKRAEERERRRQEREEMGKAS